MAVLEGLEGIEVMVRVDDQALHEYDDDEVERQPGAIGEYQASKAVGKYVEAVTGKEFAMLIKVSAPYTMNCPSLSFHVKIDGSTIDKPLLLKEKYRDRKWKKVVRGIKHQLDGGSERCSIKHFRFAEIQTTEDQAKLACIEDDANRISDVGELSVWIFRKAEGVRAHEIVNFSLESSLEGTIHEKALKGQPKSHGTSLGVAQPAMVGNVYRSAYLDGEDKPIGIYRFKYRSREALKSLLIIERTPEPEPGQQQAAESLSPATALDDGLTPEMKRKIEEYKKSLLEAANVSRLKSDTVKHEPATRIKRESPEQGQGRKVSKKAKYKTTIDLTEDDDGVGENMISLDD